MQPYSESNDNKISSKEVALTNSSTLEQCLENSIPSDISPAVKHAQESSLHKEEMGTMKNRDIFWNMELEDHGHQIQLGTHLQNLNKDKEHAGIQQNNRHITDGHDHPFDKQYTQHRKEKASRSYEREVKDKYTNVFQYSGSDKHAQSDPEFDKFHAVLLFEKQKRALVNALIRGHNSSLTEDRRKHEQTEQRKIKFKEKLNYVQNYIAGRLSHTRPTSVKNLVIPDFLHTQEMSVFHNRTSEEQNNTGQDSVLQNRNAHAHSDCGPSHKQQAALSNCNFRYSTFYCEP